MIYEDWRVPPAFQDIVLADAILSDDANLADIACMSDAGSVQVTVVYTLERYMASNFGPEVSNQWKLANLREFVEIIKESSWKAHGCRAILESGLLEEERIDDDYHDSDDHASTADGVRKAAIAAVAQLSEKGDQATITALIERIADPREEVVHAALQALAHVAEKGDHQTITALTGLIMALIANRSGSEDSEYRLTRLEELVEHAEYTLALLEERETRHFYVSERSWWSHWYHCSAF
jgi:hypothetical protein